MNKKSASILEQIFGRKIKYKIYKFEKEEKKENNRGQAKSYKPNRIILIYTCMLSIKDLIIVYNFKCIFFLIRTKFNLKKMNFNQIYLH